MTYFQLYFYMLHYKISLLTWKRLNFYLNIEFILPLPHNPRSSSHYPPYGSCRRCGQPRSPSDQCRWQPAYYCSPLQMTLPARSGEVLLGNPDKSWIQKQIIKLLNTDLHITRSRLNWQQELASLQTLKGRSQGLQPLCCISCWWGQQGHLNSVLLGGWCHQRILAAPARSWLPPSSSGLRSSCPPRPSAP